jgi:hypothetical protein
MLGRHDNGKFRFLIREPLGIDLTALPQMVGGRLTADYTKSGDSQSTICFAVPSRVRRLIHAGS